MDIQKKVQELLRDIPNSVTICAATKSRSVDDIMNAVNEAAYFMPENVSALDLEYIARNHKGFLELEFERSE